MMFLGEQPSKPIRLEIITLDGGKISVSCKTLEEVVTVMRRLCPRWKDFSGACRGSRGAVLEFEDFLKVWIRWAERNLGEAKKIAQKLGIGLED